MFKKFTPKEDVEIEKCKQDFRCSYLDYIAIDEVFQEVRFKLFGDENIPTFVSNEDPLYQKYKLLKEKRESAIDLAHEMRERFLEAHLAKEKKKKESETMFLFAHFK